MRHSLLSRPHGPTARGARTGALTLAAALLLGTALSAHAVTPTPSTTTSSESTAESTAPTAPAVPADTVTDTFDRTVTGGWGSAPSGGTWTSGSTAATYAVAAGAGTQRVASGSSGTMYLDGPLSTDTDTRVDVAFDRRADSDAAVYASVLGRAIQGVGDYRARLVVGRDGVVELRLGRGTTVLARTLLRHLVYVPDAPTTVRVQITGTHPTTLRAKAWPSGSAEPEGWQLTTTDSTQALQAPGGLALSTYVAYNDTPIVASYSNVRVAPTVVPNAAPTASFTAHTDDLAVVLDATGSTDSDGSITSVSWDHGDGTTSTGPTSGHTYATPGERTVTLTVTDDRGAVATASRTVTAVAPNVPPVAEFTAEITDLALTADAGASSDSDGTVTGYRWDLGDGTELTGATATHTYAAPGDYPVTLTVTDDRGGVATSTTTVTAAEPPVLATWTNVRRGAHISGHYQKNILHNRTGSSSASESQKAAANLDYLQGWETWRDTPGTVFADFTASNTWSTVDAYSGEHNGWATLPDRYRVNVGVPILTSDTSTNLRLGSRGAYTAHQPDGSTTGKVTPFKNLAQGFVDRGMGGRVIYRLGWEFNAKTTFRWGLNGNNKGGNPSYGEGKPAQGVEEFKAYWRLIVADIRSVDPDAIIHWCPINGWDGTGETVESMYPGDAWVDMVGSDVYDNDYRGSQGVYADLQHGSLMAPADRAVLHQRMWDEFVLTGNKGYGLTWLADFAAEHDKWLGFGEWSNYPLHNTPFGSTATRGWGGGDNPTMVQNFWDYLQAQRGRGTDVMDVHYDANVHDGDFSFYPDAPFSLAAAKYRELWGQLD